MTPVCFLEGSEAWAACLKGSEVLGGGFNLWLISSSFLVSGDVLDLCIGNEVSKWILERDVTTVRKKVHQKYLIDW